MTQDGTPAPERRPDEEGVGVRDRLAEIDRMLRALVARYVEPTSVPRPTEGLVSLEEVAADLRQPDGWPSAAELKALWYDQRGAPQLTKLKRGAYYVDRDELADYLANRRLPRAEDRDETARLIRRSVADEATRQRRVRVLPRHRDTAVSS